MEDFYRIQSEAIKRYFTHLTQFGYMDDVKVSQMLLGILLIDTLDYFEGYVTEEYFNNVKRILKELKCCNCTIEWHDYKSATTPANKNFILTQPIRVVEWNDIERQTEIGTLRLPNLL